METVQNSRRNTLKVAVVGGGMCGVAVTAGLLKAGIDVHLYEAAVSSQLIDLDKVTLV